MPAMVRTPEYKPLAMRPTAMPPRMTAGTAGMTKHANPTPMKREASGANALHHLYQADGERMSATTSGELMKSITCC